MSNGSHPIGKHMASLDGMPTTLVGACANCTARSENARGSGLFGGEGLPSDVRGSVDPCCDDFEHSYVEQRTLYRRGHVVRSVFCLIAILTVMFFAGASWWPPGGARAQQAGDPGRVSPYAPQPPKPAVPALAPPVTTSPGSGPSGASRLGANTSTAGRPRTAAKRRVASRGARERRAKRSRATMRVTSVRAPHVRQQRWRPATSIRLRGRGVEAYFRHQMEHGR